ncbi:unnamed protein product [Rotaria sordida]|uniref:Uncharacterized protein n=1 Tax=Rotaria sordida TaxID=392033 RepID=A0A818QS06_9BILA|nr:unnamed protein product [Rotaria sordida]
MTLKQLAADQNNKTIHNHEVGQPDFDINIRNQKVETVQLFTYLGCAVSRDQKPDEEINTRIIIGVNLGDRMSNDKILEITGQPPIEKILCRNRAVNRRNDDLAAFHGVTKRKIIEILVKNANNHYVCPGCGIQFKPQGITNHGRRSKVLEMNSNDCKTPSELCGYGL